MTQDTGFAYDQSIFTSGVNLYISIMRVYDQGGNLKYTWNWAASEGVGLWTNSEIEHVIVV